jgi:RHS repeat-associated protein
MKIHALCLLALLVLLASMTSRAQSPTNGEPWTYSGIDGYGYNTPTPTNCWGPSGSGVGQCCAPTMSATQCANETTAIICAQGQGIWCGNNAVSCTLESSVLAGCALSVGGSAYPTAPQAGFFVSTHTQPLADCGCDKNNNNKVGHPISPANGNVSHRETDIPAQGSSPLSAFQRFYNSADTNITDLGVGWRHSFSRQIVPVVLPTPSMQNFYPSDPQDSAVYGTPANACNLGWAQVSATSTQWASATSSYANGVCSLSQSGSVVATIPVFNIVQLPLVILGGTTIGLTAARDDGQQVTFALNGTTIVPPTGVTLRLTYAGTGYQLIDDDDNVEIYNSNGNLTSVTTRSGIVETITYDSSNRLSTIKDSFGHQLILGYNSQNQLVSATDPNSNEAQYGYNSLGLLSTVTNLDNTNRSYVYENTTYPTLLTGIIDESNVRYATWGYDSQGRGNSSQEAGGADATSLTYNTNGTVTTTDALGTVRTFTFNIIGNQNRVTSISGYQCPTCTESAATTYDSAGFVSGRTDYNGNLTCYANDPVRGLELVRVEGFAPGSTCPANLSTYTPASGTLQRKFTTTWSATWREPQLITEPNRTTGFTYDGYGNVLTKTITDLTVTPNIARTWTYVYYSSGLYGQVHTLTGPRTDITTDVTTYSYYNCTTGITCGQIDTVTSAPTANAPSGLVTTYTSYDTYGLPLTISDANGVVTTLIYDARQRLLSSQVGTETSSDKYFPTGLLEMVTLPDLSTVQFAYDGAHRLTTITDGLGNNIAYTLDALGNHLADNSYDPFGTLHRTHTRVFNTLSQLYQDINAAGTSAVTTTLGYDANGNLTSSDAPLSRNTGYVPDVLNRLAQITDPNGGITVLGYDANDNVASVQDPRTLTTSYSHDGFNEVVRLVSPDTGTSLDTYDSAGNLKTTTDARSALGNYAYDALNRETQVAYSDQTINFSYDSGTNGLGRLTGASDANHSMSWSYDTHGRVTSKSQTMTALSITRTVGYNYVNGDLTTVVTPSGQTITYGYNNHRIIWMTVNGTTLLNGGTTLNGTTELENQAYDPFGPVTAWTWGNGTTVSRVYDKNGTQSSIVTAGVTNGYTPDNATRITAITDSGLASNSWSFTYWPLDTVMGGTSSALTRGYIYDANGNVNTISGTVASTINVSTTNNQINSTTGGIVRTYAYDAAGNTQSYASNSYTFNQRGRMSSAITSGGTTNYIYNALGQLIEKSGNGGTILLVYDEAGHLLGEYSSTGTLIEETIWLGDLPVATLRPNGSTVAIYYVHTDQLGTARKVTRPSDNGLMWRWDPDTYGSLPANSNPAGLGTFTYNLGFPGQYYLIESGLYQNYFRDYDPSTGRYIESDPIGLRGGRNTYGYGGANPISNSDPEGLVKWTGTLFTLGVVGDFGAIYDEATLYSECVNGERLAIEVSAVGPAAGAGVMFSATVSDISFEDYQNTLDPNGFNGAFTTGTASATLGALPTSGSGPGPVSPIGIGLPGIGVGVGYVQMGKNFSNPLPPGLVLGRDKSVAGAVGTSTVTSVTKSPCNCGH